MSSESLKSLIVTDPDLVDPELDVSGLRTQTDTDPRLLASIADFPGISYDPTEFSYLTDLNELFAYGLPLVDTPTAPNINIPLPGGSGSGGGGDVSATMTTPSANTPEDQRLIDEGIGLQVAPGQPVFAPGEIPVTQDELDAFNQIPVTPVNEFTTGDASLAEQIAAEDRAAQLANVQDPTTMLPQLGTDTPTVFDGTATLEDAGAGEGGMQLAEVGLGDEADFTPSSTYDEAGLQIAEAPFGINPATGEPYQTPRTIADQNRVLGVVTEEDLVDDRNLLQKLGLPEGFDLKKAALETGVNLAVGVPITLIAQALGTVLPDDNIAPSTNIARSTGLLQGDTTVTQDKYGINTQTSFDPVQSTTNYNNYNVKQVEKLENRLEELRTGKYKDDFQAYLDNTKRMRQELKDRKEYLDAVNKDPLYGGDIDATPTGDAQIAEETIGTLPEITEARQKQGEQIQEIQQQEVVQSGSDEADRQQRDTGVAKVAENRYETKSGDVYASAAEAAEKSDGGGGGSSSSKIVCTMMNESYGFGSFRNKIWMKFHKDLSPEYQRGYHKLFLPLVKIAKKNMVVKKILEHIAVHSTIDMRQSMRGKTHLLGRIYRKILLPLCYWVGKNG